MTVAFRLPHNDILPFPRVMAEKAYTRFRCAGPSRPRIEAAVAQAIGDYTAWIAREFPAFSVAEVKDAAHEGVAQLQRRYVEELKAAMGER